MGLALNATFEDLECIIGEFDYLNELMKKREGASSDVIYIRMPYGVKFEEIPQTITLAKDLCRKKYHQLHPELPMKSVPEVSISESEDSESSEENSYCDHCDHCAIQ